MDFEVFNVLSDIIGVPPLIASLFYSISYCIFCMLFRDRNWKKLDAQDKIIFPILISLLIYFQSIAFALSVKSFFFFFDYQFPVKKFGGIFNLTDPIIACIIVMYPIFIGSLFYANWIKKKIPLYKQEKLLYEMVGGVTIVLPLILLIILFYTPFLTNDLYRWFTLEVLCFIILLILYLVILPSFCFLFLTLRTFTKSLDCDDDVNKFLKNFKKFGLSPYITWIKSNKKLTFSIVVVCVFILFLLMTPKNVTPQVSLSDKELYEVSIKGQFNHDGKYSSEQFCRTLSISNEIRQNINVTPPRFKIVGWLVVHTDLGEAKLIQKPDYVKIEKTKNGKNYLLFNLSAMDKPYRSTLNGFEKGYDCSNNIIDRKVRKLIDDYDLGLYSYTANLTFSCANIRNDHAFLSIPIKEEDFSLYVHLQEILISPIKNCTVEWYDYNPKSKGDYVDVKTLGARKVYINIAKRCENNESITVTYEVICSRNTSR